MGLLNKMLCRLQNLSSHCGEQKNLTLSGVEPVQMSLCFHDMYSLLFINTAIIRHTTDEEWGASLREI